MSDSHDTVTAGHVGQVTEALGNLCRPDSCFVVNGSGGESSVEVWVRRSENGSLFHPVSRALINAGYRFNIDMKRGDHKHVVLHVTQRARSAGSLTRVRRGHATAVSRIVRQAKSAARVNWTGTVVRVTLHPYDGGSVRLALSNAGYIYEARELSTGGICLEVTHKRG